MDFLIFGNYSHHIKRFLWLGLFWLVGCAGTIQHDPSGYLSQDTSTGVLIDCFSPIGATDIVGHLIKIDKGDQWIQVAPKSLKVVYLTPGVHEIEFISAGSKSGSQYYPGYEILKDEYYTYGKSVWTQVKVRKGALRKVKYTGPFWESDVGTIEIGGYSINVRR